MRKPQKPNYALALEVVARIMNDIEKRKLYYRDDRGRPL